MNDLVFTKDETQEQERLSQVLGRIHRACLQAQRTPKSVHLLAVSKKCSVAQVVSMARAGQYSFGENYIQEGVAKKIAVTQLLSSMPSVEWHCLGPIQSNKTQLVAEYFDWVQSLDRIKIAERLAQQRPVHLPPLNICIQVNIDASLSKTGVAPENVLVLAKTVAALPNLRLRGIMAIPDPQDNGDRTLAIFQKTHAVWQALRYEYSDVDTFSLGMSADLEYAVAAGSTMVRVGTALFGSRASQRV